MYLWRRLIRGTSKPASPSGPGGPLEGIDTIDWANLEHAYGPAADVPGQLRDVAVGSPRQRSKAMSELWGNIHHQGTVYPASAPSVPFLARLAGSRAIPEGDRGQLVALISAIASGSSYLEVHEPMIRGGLSDEERQDLEKELGWVRAAHEAAAAVTPGLLAEIGEIIPRDAVALGDARRPGFGSRRGRGTVPPTVGKFTHRSVTTQGTRANPRLDRWHRFGC